MRFLAVYLSLTSLVWGGLFLATRVSLFAQGHAQALAVDRQNNLLSQNCMDATYRDSLGTKAFICDEVSQETARWPAWRALDFTFAHTHLCGTPCAELLVQVAGNPMTLLMVGAALLAMPYVSLLMARPTRPPALGFGTEASLAPMALENGGTWWRKDKGD
jgi:hypothetical protein